MIKLFVCGDFRAKDVSRVEIDKDLRDLIFKADISVCNFEAPVVSNGKPIKKSGPTLDQDIKSPNFIRDLGFNVILMANNHIMDYGKEGCQKTLESFPDCVCVGAGQVEEAYRVKIVEKNGI